MHNFNYPILMYHSIEQMPKSTIMRSLHVSPRQFKFQMLILKSLGYKALSLKKLKPYIDGEKSGRVVGLTFDDGYHNNLINAAPILKKLDFSATCFIVNDYIGQSNLWDSALGISQRPLMDESEINKWLEYGMDIGAHSKTHANLIEVPKKNLYREIRESKVELEDKFNTPITDFCYPFGRFNEYVCNVVEKSGYLLAVSMLRGRANLDSDKYILPRVPINYRTLPHLFLTKIMSRYEDRRQFK